MNNAFLASSAQKRIFFLDRLHESNTVYNLPNAWAIEGNIERNHLEKALAQLTTRHESLRTSFTINEGKVFQRVHRQLQVELIILPPGGISIGEKLTGFTRPFDLENAPLWRLGISEIEPGSHALLLDIHHIISDGISVGIFIYELMILYSGKELPALEFQYVDFTLWQNQMFESPLMKAQETFWLTVFKGEVPILELPTDFSRSNSHETRGKTICFNIAHAQILQVKELASYHKTTLNVLLLGITNLILSRYSGQEDIIIANPVSGRSHDEFKPIIGMFVNTLALRINAKSSLSFPEYIQSVSDILFTAFDNQDYPFELLVEKLNPERDPNRNPITDVMFILQEFEHPIEPPVEFKITPHPGKAETAKFDLLLTAYEDDRQILFDLNYRASLFKEETITRMVSHFKNIIFTICENPIQLLSEIEMLSSEEKRELLINFNDTHTPYLQGKTLHGLFEEQTTYTPNQIAVSCESSQITYRELNLRADKIALKLTKQGVTTNTIVAIQMERSIEMIAGIFGILKTGGAYLPIDPQYPRDRIDFMLKDSGAVLMLATEGGEMRSKKRDSRH